MTWPIQLPSAELQALIQLFGIYEAPARFGLAETVAPVSIVDSRITLSSQSTPTIWTLRATAGELTNPAANTRLFDTGALAAGIWMVDIHIAIGAAGMVLRVRQRNAADAADIHSTLISLVSLSNYDRAYVFSVAENERVVLENNTAPGAGIVIQGIGYVTKLV